MALEVFVVEGWPGDEVSSLSYFDVISEACVVVLMLQLFAANAPV